MELSITSQDDATIRISVSGGITQKQLHQSEEILPKLGGKDVYTKSALINLKDNDFIDSSGINWLLLCHKRFIENDGRMVLHSIPPIVDSVLKIIRMESVFEIAGTEEEAAKAAASPRPTAPSPRPEVNVKSTGDDAGADGAE